MTGEDIEQRFAHMLINCIECAPPDGWCPLVAECLERLDAMGGVTIGQIKQKLGTLEIYTNELGDNYREAWDLIDGYRRRSRLTCETCGCSGRTRSDGWYIHVACEEHVR